MQIDNEKIIGLTRMDVSPDFDLDERKDGGQLPQLSLGVHLLQCFSDEIVVKPVERQELATVRVGSEISVHGGCKVPRHND